MIKKILVLVLLVSASGFLQAQKTDDKKAPSQKSAFVGLWESAERHIAILYANGKLEITKAGIMLCTANWIPHGTDKIRIFNIALRLKAKEPVPDELFLDVLGPKKVKLAIDNKEMIFRKMK
jgi:hypothetical protein